jgi:hypothetical protein
MRILAPFLPGARPTHSFKTAYALGCQGKLVHFDYGNSASLALRRRNFAHRETLAREWAALRKSHATRGWVCGYTAASQRTRERRMFGRLAAGTALMVLAACAGVESAGRSARESGAAPPVISSAPSPAPAPAPAPTPEPSVAAPNVAVATPPPPRQRSGDDDIVVRGEYESIPQPEGDFRSRAQRNEDIRSWDQCVTAVQAAYERDPMRPQLETAEEYCGRSLGMADRTAVPESRIRSR